MKRTLALVCIAWLTCEARAQTVCSELPGARELGPKPRLESIRSELSTEAPRAHLWRWGWAGAYGALTVGQLVPIPLLADRGLRIDFAVGAISSAAGMAVLLAFPLQVGSDASRVAELSDDCAGLAEAERLFAEDTQNEADGRHWLMHLANVGLNAIFGLVLGLGFGRWESGVANFAGGVLLGELTLFTQPDRLTDARRRYQADQPIEWAVLPVVSAGGLGLQLAGRF